jgi:dTMP kinase
MFITFEGLDFSGKTTQAVMLVEELKHAGKDVLFLREPGGTSISERIRDLLLDRVHLEMNPTAELLLFSAARSQLVTEVIEPALQRGTIVISDRFYDSTTAYQGNGRGLDLNDVRMLNRIATGGRKPDLTLFIDVGIDELLRRRHAARAEADRMESSGRAFYERVRRGYIEIAQLEPDRCRTINGERSIESIRDEISRLVNERLLTAG